jgi:hypothetical protein
MSGDERLSAYAALFLKYNMTMPTKLQNAREKMKSEEGPVLRTRQNTEVQGKPISGSVFEFASIRYIEC